ncbi:hypothetical protein DFJ74DRAFT_23121 [Hyaloraphidium curvatum]|nr:hypothetical protein DFJ74DRAFT_23121 [Hyaloraphidium curvatum]
MAKVRVRFLLLVVGALLLVAHALLRHSPRPPRRHRESRRAQIVPAAAGYAELAVGVRSAALDAGEALQRVAVQQATFLQWAASVALVGQRRLGAGPHFSVAVEAHNDTHVPSLLYLRKRFGAAEWYLLADDDSYVFLANIRHHVRRHGLEPGKPHFLGYAMHFRGCAGIKEFGEGPTFAQSSSGILVSREALWMLQERGSCAGKYPDCEVGEVRLGLCLRDAGVKMGAQRDGFHLIPPTSSSFAWPPPCEYPLAFPKAGGLLAQALYDAEREKRQAVEARLEVLARAAAGNRTDAAAYLARLNATAGGMYRLAPVVTYADVHARLALPDHQADHLKADIAGGDFHEVQGVGTWAECRAACEGGRHPEGMGPCVAWTHVEDTALCRLKDRIGAIRQAATNLVSGVVPGNYRCD